MKALTVDKLELCYKIPVELHEYLRAGESIDLDNFRLDLKYIQFSQVVYNVTYTGNQIPTTYNILGEFRIIISEESDDVPFKYAWLDFYNKALYSVGDQFNLYILHQMFSNEFGIQLNNVTRFELALDSTSNLGDLISEAYTDSNAALIVVGKVYELTDYIPYVTRECWGSRLVPQLVHWRIKGSDSKFQLYCYNKAQELSKGEKKYICDYYHVESFNKLWRLELRANKDAIWDYLQLNYITWEEFLQSLLNNESKDTVMDVLSGRLMRLRYTRINKPSIYRYIDTKLSE